MGRKKSKHDRKQEATAPAARGWSVRYTLILAVTAVAGVLIGMGWRNAMHSASPAASVANTAPLGDSAVDREPENADGTRDSQGPPLDLQKLKGQWVRTDAGYVIDIKRVDGSGSLDVAYLNPKPIHVAKAEATAHGTSTKVFIELQDVNYPGSTYNLTYDAAGDRLTGIYYQAVQQQQFEVSFDRAESRPQSNGTK